MANITRIKELAGKLFLTNIEKGRIELNNNSDTELNFLEFILAKEVEMRRSKKIETAIKRSNITTFYNLDDFKSNLTENITSWHIDKLKDTSSIDKKKNVIISSGAGTGKTMLAVATANNALKKGYKVFYITISDLIIYNRY